MIISENISERKGISVLCPWASAKVSVSVRIELRWIFCERS